MSYEYQTSDFPTAITLLVLKHVLKGLDRRDPRRASFQFEHSPKLLADLEALRGGKIKVDPFEFWYAQKRLKQLLYEDQQL